MPRLLLARLRRLPLLAVVCAVVTCPMAGCAAAGGGGHAPGPRPASAGPAIQQPSRVLRYARRLRADPHALMGYYRRQVLYHLADGWVLLPSGYGTDPAVRPIPVRV